MSTIEQLYAAFARCDGAGMAACYAPDARFSDPVFGELRGDRVTGMWRMLTAQARDLRITLVDHTADTAHWTAHYTFSRTNRPVVNDVHARFRLDDAGLIAEHDDSFSFWRWSRQALGTPGLLLGWTPVLQRKVRGTSRTALDRFLAG